MSKKYIQNKKIIQSKIGEEVVMMDVDSGFYFGMNGVGSIIWKHLSTAMTLEEIVSSLMDEFNVDKSICESDTIEFLNNLLEKKIIKVVE